MMNISTTDVYAYSTHMVMSPSKVGLGSACAVTDVEPSIFLGIFILAY